MFSRFILWIPVAMLGCRDTDNEAPVTVDADGDGWGEEADCDDANAAVNGAAAELCDGIDNDCDGAVDQDATDAPTWYRDADLDGFGDARDRAAACAAPEGYVASAEDCDDLDAAAHPGASEADCADPKDYNCDGSTGFSDLDGDGFAACQECDDALAAVHPGAPAGYVASPLDCDDSAASAHPGGVEVCDSLDNDCDGRADEEATGAPTWYLDHDGDGWGDDAFTVEQAHLSWR